MSIGSSRSLGGAPRIWLSRHLASLVYSLGVISRQPLNSGLAICVIAFALALPTGLYLLLDNARAQVVQLREPPQIAVYLQPGVDTKAAAALAKQLLSEFENIRLGRIISPREALEDFRKQAGFSQSLDYLEGENPLPAVILLHPLTRQPRQIEDLLGQLRQQPEVEFVQAEVRWLQRLAALLNLAGRGLGVLAVLLAGGVVLVVANILRLNIASRRDEIEISALFGASDAFVRRPFLYHGALYGFLGAFLGLGLLGLCKLLLAAPLQQLNRVFDSQYSLLSMDLPQILIVLAAGLILGLGGAWIAVSMHLHTIRPN